MSQIVLSKVNKHYGGVQHAVKDIDLTVGDKEFVVLVGPSGCGHGVSELCNVSAHDGVR